MKAIATIIASGILFGIITTSIYVFLILKKSKKMNPTKITPFLISDNSLHITINSEKHQNDNEFFVLDSYNDELLEICKKYSKQHPFSSVVVKKVKSLYDSQTSIFVVIIK